MSKPASPEKGPRIFFQNACPTRQITCVLKLPIDPNFGAQKGGRQFRNEFFKRIRKVAESLANRSIQAMGRPGCVPYFVQRGRIVTRIVVE